MGQKINPIGFRLGINRTWDSRWFADNAEYGQLLHEDIAIRKYLMAELKQAGIAKVVIERPHKKCRVTIHSARPGLIIGKKGADIEKLRKKISEMTKSETHLNIVEVRKPEIDSTLVAQGIAQQLERRVAFRRAMKRAVQSAMRLGAEGIKITCGGRLGGAEIARTEWYREGRVPLHTLRADIDFGLAHFDDVEVRFRIRHLRQLLAELVDVCALAADDQARTCRVDRDAALLVRTLDDHLGDPGLLQFAHDELAHLQVFVQQLTVLGIVRKPAAIPGTVDAEAETDWIDFLTHYAASSAACTSRTTIVRCAKGFSMRDARPRPRAWKRFMTIDLPT